MEINAGECAVRISEVNKSLDFVKDEISEIEKKIELLHTRLRPILAVCTEEPRANQPSPLKMPLSEEVRHISLASAINVIARRIGRCGERIQNIIDLCEL